MKKVFLMIAVATMAVSAAYAQKDKSGIEYQNLRGPFVTNSFGDNWFISAGAGVDFWARPSRMTGEEYKGFGKIAPVYTFSIGKMLHPVYGVRLQGTYGTVKDYTSFMSPYTRSLKATSPTGDKYNMKFDYWSITADFLFHFSNAVGGYKEARFYNLLMVAGAGFARSNGKNMDNVKANNNEFVFNFALLNTFRLARGLDLNLELKSLVVKQGFSGNGSGAGMLPAATLGFTYKFKDRSFYTVSSFVDNAVADATRISNARISDLQRELATAEAATSRARAEADAARKAAADAEAAAKRNQNKLGEYDQIPVGFFQRGKSALSEMDMSIQYAAGVIKANPGKVYTIVGLADEETGTHDLNMQLSKQRAENVRKALIDAGVNAKQLEIKAYGDTVNPYGYGDLNRVVIIELK